MENHTKTIKRLENNILATLMRWYDEGNGDNWQIGAQSLLDSPDVNGEDLTLYEALQTIAMLGGSRRP